MLCIQQPAHVGYNNSTIKEKLQALFLKKLPQKGRNAVLLAQRTNPGEIHRQFDEARNGGVFQTRTL